VAAFRFSRQAEADLIEIAGYTLRTWGEDQSFGISKISSDVVNCWRITPNRADPVINFVQVYGEWSTEVMSCFTRRDAGGILVSRILHQRMLPEASTLDSEDREI
jgi:plasmid stabilization system protein ParE